MSSRAAVLGALGGLALAAAGGAALAALYLMSKDSEEDSSEVVEEAVSEAVATKLPVACPPPLPLPCYTDVDAARAELENPARLAALRMPELCSTVLAPLLAAVAADVIPGTELVVGDVGCGTGWALSELASALPEVTRVLGVDSEPAMRAAAAARLAADGSQHAGAVSVSAPVAGGRAGLPVRAHVLLLIEVLHCLRASERAAWLQATARHDTAPGGYIVVVEPATGVVVSNAPPDGLRLERSELLADADAAGLELVACPPLLEPERHVFVFRAPPTAA